MSEYSEKLVTFRSGRTVRVLMPEAEKFYIDFHNNQTNRDILVTQDVAGSPCILNLHEIESIISESSDNVSEKLTDDGILVIVNGVSHTVPRKHVSYEDVVTLAGKNPKAGYTVTYDKASDNNPNGDLIPGESVRVKHRTVFNVALTNGA